MDKFNFVNVLDSATGKSKILEIPLDGQLTFVAMGLRDNSQDRIEFELIKISAASFDCGWGVNDLPGIEDTMPMKLNGKALKLTCDNTFIILDAPQGFKFRVVFKYDEVLGENVDPVSVQMSRTSTPNLTPVMRGYIE